MTDEPEAFEGFRIGGRYDLHKEIWPSARGFGSFLAGINPRGRFPNTTGIVLLSRIEHGRYADTLEGDYLDIQGEDDRTSDNPKESDQSLLRGANRVLSVQAKRDIPLYVFTKEPGDQIWIYRGLGEVEGFRNEMSSDRNVVRFRISLTGFPQVVDFTKAIEEAAANRDVFEKDTERQYSDTRRPVRDPAFRRAVTLAYGQTCALCGAKRKAPDGQFEVEAAHIIPKGSRGRDVVVNGIALCRYHHWAFDHWLWWFNEDFEVSLHPRASETENMNLRRFEGAALIMLPDESTLRPSPEAISWRKVGALRNATQGRYSR